MSSRRAFPIDPFEFADESVHDPLGDTLPARNLTNMGKGDTQFTGNPSAGTVDGKLSKKLPMSVTLSPYRHFMSVHHPTGYNSEGDGCQGETLASGVETVEKERDQIPEWAVKIAALRGRLRESMSIFGARFGVTATSVQRWERGEKEPSAYNFVRLGSLAGDPECWMFWQHAGLEVESVLRVMPGLRAKLNRARSAEVIEIESAFRFGKASERGVGVEHKRKTDVIVIPLLRDAAAAGEPRLIQEADIDDMIVMHRKRVPHPEDTVCVRIAGDSMSPTLEEGDIVAIDTHQYSRESLYNKMVAARDPNGGVSIKWLRRVGEEEMLIAQHTSTRFQPVVLRTDPRWKIIGKVIWSMRMAD